MHYFFNYYPPQGHFMPPPAYPYQLLLRTIPTQSLPALKSIGDLLNQANQFLAHAQKFTPFIQQASPLLKNLPTIWRMYKTFQNLPEQPIQRDTPDIHKEKFDNTSKPSLPKIYQP